MRVSIAILTLCILPTVGVAATIWVPDDYSSIQAAIDGASNGDTIIVRAGTYFENINFNGKAIALRSESGPSVTRIDGSWVARVVTFNSGEGADSILNGFEIANGYAISDKGGGGWLLSVISNDSQQLYRRQQGWTKRRWHLC